jgi:hypothetical protein
MTERQDVKVTRIRFEIQLLADREATGRVRVPSQTLKGGMLMRSLLTLGAIAALAMSAPAEEPKARFDVPVRLMTEGVPINEKEQLLYPSPVLIDIDGDGQVELVIGDLWGKLRVYKPTGKRGEIMYGKGSVLQAAGKDLVVPNW